MKTDFSFCDKYNLCHVCQIRYKLPGKQVCSECFEKRRKYESKEKVRKRKAKRSKELYYMKKECGICTCGGCKKQAVPGRTMCKEHLELKAGKMFNEYWERKDGQ